MDLGRDLFRVDLADNGPGEAELVFVFLKLDTDAQPEAAKYFGVSGIPDARILRPDGVELARVVGFQRAEELLPILRAEAGR